MAIYPSLVLGALWRENEDIKETIQPIPPYCPAHLTPRLSYDSQQLQLGWPSRSVSPYPGRREPQKGHGVNLYASTN
jgi:hypothetical protein